MASRLGVLGDVLGYHLCPVRTMVVQDNVRLEPGLTQIDYFRAQLAHEAHEFVRIRRFAHHELQAGQAIADHAVQSHIRRTTGRDGESQSLHLRLPALDGLLLRRERALVNIDDSCA